jgi:hypothetical protein
LVFDLAARLGDPRLLAALLESARAAGVPSITGTIHDPGGPDGLAARGLAVMLTEHASAGQGGGHDSTLGTPTGGVPVAFTGPAAALNDADIALDPPPVVVMPWPGADPLAAWRREAQRTLADRPLRIGQVALADQLHH